jgi:putative membrane protein
MPRPATSPAHDPEPEPRRFNTLDAIRAVFGGVLMGLANLVPGVSGGTMLLAAGVYRTFIRGIAELSTLRFRAQTILMLGLIVGSALVAIVLGAALLRDLVVHQRWAMFSVFIGLTLGGVPIIWRLIAPSSTAKSALFILVSLVVSLLIVVYVRDMAGGSSIVPGPWGRIIVLGLAGASLLTLPILWTKLDAPDRIVMFPVIAGLTAMVLLSLAQGAGTNSAASTNGQFALLFIAGLAGGSAMILPGVSGGYLLLILGQYLVILTAISDAKSALSAGDFGALGGLMGVFVPVGLGVVIGIVGVSNLIKMLMDRYERATLGVLLGLLIGAIFGLWPFEAHVKPVIGDVIKGIVLLDQPSVDAVEASDWPTQGFTPSVFQVTGSIALIGAALMVSTVIDRFGSSREAASGG